MRFKASLTATLSLTAALMATTALSAQAATPKSHNAINAKIDAWLAGDTLNATTADEVKARCDAAIEIGTEAKTALEARTGPATLKGDYAAYDSLSLILGDAGSEIYLVTQTSPSKDVRDAANACVPRISDLGTQVSLSRPIYDRLAAIPQKGLDDKTAYTLNHQLTEYKLSGVDKDDATRARVTELQKEITETGLTFDNNINADKGDVAFKPEELAGLPQDFIDAHKPGADGMIHLTVDYPDAIPVFTYASIRDTRKKMMTAYANRGYPQNEPVLNDLLKERYDLAQALGYTDYAALATADKMIGTPDHAQAFLDEVNTAAKPGADADTAELLAFAQTIDPTIDHLERYDGTYFSNLLKKQKYDVDEAEVRQYFTRDKAEAGIFKLVHDLFDADIRPWKTKVWSPDVTAWELYDQGKLVGRFYLDLSPRDGKYNHEAQFPIRTGVQGRQVPVGALLCNFPATGPMEHGDVTTFLHEFGHLIHNMYSGHTQYSTQSMNNLQWDFIEAPSQLLEEWTFDYDTLKGFASNDKGEPIPEDLVKKMNAARHFGEASQWKGQIAYAAVSMDYYHQAPGFDLTQTYNNDIAKYSMYPPMDNTHPQDAFGHLNGYSAIYYTYVWSKAIALDLFTKFKADGMRNKATALRYRKLVLEPGGSEDANVLIQNFLGRPLSLDAFKDELAKKE